MIALIKRQDMGMKEVLWPQSPWKIRDKRHSLSYQWDRYISEDNKGEFLVSNVYWLLLSRLFL